MTPVHEMLSRLHEVTSKMSLHEMDDGTYVNVVRSMSDGRYTATKGGLTWNVEIQGGRVQDTHPMAKGARGIQPHTQMSWGPKDFVPTGSPPIKITGIQRPIPAEDKRPPHMFSDDDIEAINKVIKSNYFRDKLYIHDVYGFLSTSKNRQGEGHDEYSAVAVINNRTLLPYSLWKNEMGGNPHDTGYMYHVPKVKQAIQTMVRVVPDISNIDMFLDGVKMTVGNYLRQTRGRITVPPMYHGTLHFNVSKIRVQGLVPRAKSPTKGKGWGGDMPLRHFIRTKMPGTGDARQLVHRPSPGNTEDAVYLTADKDHAKIAASGAADKTKEFMGKIGIPVLLRVEPPDPKNLYPDDDVQDPTWQLSMASSGAAVAHLGRIPATNITPFMMVDEHDNWIPYDAVKANEIGLQLQREEDERRAAYERAVAKEMEDDKVAAEKAAAEYVPPTPAEKVINKEIWDMLDNAYEDY